MEYYRNLKDSVKDIYNCELFVNMEKNINCTRIANSYSGTYGFYDINGSKKSEIMSGFLFALLGFFSCYVGYKSYIFFIKYRNNNHNRRMNAENDF